MLMVNQKYKILSSVDEYSRETIPLILIFISSVDSLQTTVTTLLCTQRTSRTVHNTVIGDRSAYSWSRDLAEHKC